MNCFYIIVIQKCLINLNTPWLFNSFHQLLIPCFLLVINFLLYRSWIHYSVIHLPKRIYSSLIKNLKCDRRSKIPRNYMTGHLMSELKINRTTVLIPCRKTNEQLEKRERVHFTMAKIWMSVNEWLCKWGWVFSSLEFFSNVK